MERVLGPAFGFGSVAASGPFNQLPKLLIQQDVQPINPFCIRCRIVDFSRVQRFVAQQDNRECDEHDDHTYMNPRSIRRADALYRIVVNSCVRSVVRAQGCGFLDTVHRGAARWHLVPWRPQRRPLMPTASAGSFSGSSRRRCQTVTLLRRSSSGHVTKSRSGWFRWCLSLPRGQIFRIPLLHEEYSVTSDAIAVVYVMNRLLVPAQVSAPLCSGSGSGVGSAQKLALAGFSCTTQFGRYGCTGLFEPSCPQLNTERRDQLSDDITRHLILRTAIWANQPHNLVPLPQWSILPA
jgi:hypothetical protein